MILQKEISSFSSLGGEIILGEDFNSRLGTKHKDYILSDTNEFLPIDSSITETDILTLQDWGYYFPVTQTLSVLEISISRQRNSTKT